MVMRRLGYGIGLAVLGSALLAAGCQLIAGVRTDATPIEGHDPDGGGCKSNGDCASNLCTNGTCCIPGPQEALCAGKCGQLQDECGQMVACGGCNPPETCGALTPNECRCAPGCPMWANVYGGSTSGMKGAAVALNAAGHVVLTGDFFSSINFGGGTINLVGNGDAFFAELDGTGSQVTARSFGVAGSDQYGSAIAGDAAGNTLLAGNFHGDVDFGDGMVTDGIGLDLYVAKLDASGKHVWSKRFGDIGDQSARALAVDGSGNVIVAGHFSGVLDFGGNNALPGVGADDLFVAKLDPSGDTVWAKSFGSTGDDELGGIAVDGTGNVILIGTYPNDITFGSTLSNQGGKDVFVAKLDASGTPVWAIPLGDASDQRGYGVATDAGGNIFITGGFQGTINFVGGDKVTSANNDGVFVAKLDTSGTPVWTKAFTGDASTKAHGRSIAISKMGDVVVAGDIDGSLDFGGGARLAYPGFFVIGLDPSNGDHVWSRTFAGGTIVQPPALATDFNSDVIISGSYTGAIDFGFGPVTANNGVANLFLMKLGRF
ncbi:Hypothetical protein A7982_03078 [Minicystis rosea]|nr:Hypothetical protein A7982_03078 [Minicystis rosea]